MRKIQLKGYSSQTDILVGAPFTKIRKYIKSPEIFILTDDNLKERVASEFQNIPTYPLTPGEHSKSLRSATEIYRWLQDNQADRHAILVGIGGGVVCDMAGFIAATYLRGIRVMLVPTTLLAQVDAAIGGKNAVNLDGFKNIIGTVHQPELVLSDLDFIRTLPPTEVTGGMAEVIKHCIIADCEHYDFLVNKHQEIKQLDMPIMEELVAWSVELKRRFVEKDEFDLGERRKLNFGHTWGHAVEGVTGIHHGFAVSIGMVFAARFGYHLGVTPASTVDKIERILSLYNLPLETHVLPWVIYEAMQKDKKKEDDTINFILPKEIGEVVVQRVEIDTVKEYIK